MRIYLDHNATTPVDSRVVDAVTGVLRDQFGNASSVHTFGQSAKSCVDDARSAVATLLGAGPQEIVFTSGGTEADNLAIRGVADARCFRNQLLLLRPYLVLTKQLSHDIRR